MDATGSSLVELLSAKIDLGGTQSPQALRSERFVEDIRSTMRQRAQRAFVLVWEGNKIPRGAKVLNHTIAWTQHGVVTDDAGGVIGMYDRLLEFGGQSGKLQVMVVYATNTDAARVNEVAAAD